MNKGEVYSVSGDLAICAHYWLIESPNGPTSQGTCIHCGEEREFRNSVQISSWESEGGNLRNRVRLHAERSL